MDEPSLSLPEEQPLANAEDRGSISPASARLPEQAPVCTAGGPNPSESGVAESGDTEAAAKAARRGRSKKWDPICLPDVVGTPPAELERTPLPPGCEIVFFPQNMKFMFTAPSEMLLCTRGLLDYINEYNIHGPSKTKAKLFSCTMFVQSGACSNGFACREVHFVRPDSADIDPRCGLPVAIRCNEVHHRAPRSGSGGSAGAGQSALDLYPRLPAGHAIPLSLPNMSHASEEFATERIYVTKGIQEYYDAMLCGEPPSMNMQHCAHFAKNGMCCFGPDCRFVHVADFTIEPNSDSHSDSGSTRSSSRGGSAASSSSRRSAAGGKRSQKFGCGSGSGSGSSVGLLFKDTPLSLGSIDDSASAGAHQRSVQLSVQPQPQPRVGHFAASDGMRSAGSSLSSLPSYGSLEMGRSGGSGAHSPPFLCSPPPVLVNPTLPPQPSLPSTSCMPGSSSFTQNPQQGNAGQPLYVLLPPQTQPQQQGNQHFLPLQFAPQQFYHPQQPQLQPLHAAPQQQQYQHQHQHQHQQVFFLPPQHPSQKPQYVMLQDPSGAPPVQHSMQPMQTPSMFVQLPHQSHAYSHNR